MPDILKRTFFGSVLMGWFLMSATMASAEQPLPSNFQFIAPRYPATLGDIMTPDQVWQVQPNTIEIISPGTTLQWLAEIRSPSGRTGRVECTSRTVFPNTASGGSYFEANCQRK